MVSLFCIAQNTGSEEYLFLLGWGIWLAFCFGIGLLFPANRKKKGMLFYAMGMGVSALLLDMLGLAIFFSQGEYVNRGAACSLMIFLCGGAILLAAVLVLSTINHCRKGMKQ